MPELSINQVVQVLQAAGALGALIIGIWGGLKGWWFPGWYVAELRERLAKLEADKTAIQRDRDEWKDLAHSNSQTASQGADLVRQVLVAMAPSHQDRPVPPT